MTNGFTVDASGLQRLAADLGEVAAEAHVNVRVAVQQSAAAIQTAWNDKLYREGSARLTGGSISHDITEGVLGVAADIGPKRGNHRQAGIVRLLENGSINNAPHGYGAAALDENEVDFEARLAFALYAALETHGLP